VTHKLRTIAVSECNYTALKSLGKAGDSFNDVISKLLIDSSDNRIETPSSQNAVDARTSLGGEAE
jgi:predicted CopG family antitoxin